MNVVGIGQVIAVLNDLRAKKIINEFAIGGAVAAVLHNEPISTIDLDIFFFLAEKDDRPILSLSAIYDYAKKMALRLMRNLSIFTVGCAIYRGK